MSRACRTWEHVHGGYWFDDLLWQSLSELWRVIATRMIRRFTLVIFCLFVCFVSTTVMSETNQWFESTGKNTVGELEYVQWQWLYTEKHETCRKRGLNASRNPWFQAKRYIEYVHSVAVYQKYLTRLCAYSIYLSTFGLLSIIISNTWI